MLLLFFESAGLFAAAEVANAKLIDSFTCTAVIFTWVRLIGKYDVGI